MKKFDLVTHEGAFCKSVTETNFRKAREEFAKRWEGDFKIIDMSEAGAGESKNVRL